MVPFIRSMILVALLLIPGLAGSADLYFGASFGRTNNEFLPTFNPAASESIDDQDNAYKITFGWGLTPNLAVEADYGDLNSLVKATSPGQSTEITAKAIGLSFVGKASVHPTLQMFGRFGIQRWDSDLTVNGVSASGSGTDTLIGLGIIYKPQNFPLDFRLEWTQYQNVGQGVTTPSTRLTGQNVDVIWFGIAYHLNLTPGP